MILEINKEVLLQEDAILDAITQHGGTGDIGDTSGTSGWNSISNFFHKHMATENNAQGIENNTKAIENNIRYIGKNSIYEKLLAHQIGNNTNGVTQNMANIAHNAQDIANNSQAINDNGQDLKHIAYTVGGLGLAGAGAAAYKINNLQNQINKK